MLKTNYKLTLIAAAIISTQSFAATTDNSIQSQLIEFNQGGTIKQNLFAKGKFMAVGVNHFGTFGSNASLIAPEGFQYYNKGNYRLGLFADLDGLESGEPANTNDFFLPGAEFEGFTIAYIKPSGEKHFIKHHGDSRADTLTTTNLLDLSTEEQALIRWKGSNEDIAVTIDYTFQPLDKHYSTFVTIENISDNDLVDVRYSRGIDPDQDTLNGSYATDNTIEKQSHSFAHVSATGRAAEVSIHLASKTSKPVVANNLGFYQTDLYSDSLYELPTPEGNSVFRDSAIYLTMVEGDLETNQKKSFYYVTALTSDIDAVFEAEDNRDPDGDGIISKDDPDLKDPCIPNVEARACSNVAPIVNDTTINSYKNKAILLDELTLLANASDANEDDILTIEGEPKALKGVITRTSDGWVYTPELDYFGEDQISYVVSDGLLKAAGMIKLIIADTVAPNAEDDQTQTFSDQSILIDVLSNDSDEDGNVNDLILSINTQPLQGEVTIEDNKIRYSYTGEKLTTPLLETFSYQIKDSSELSDSANVKVTVVSPIQCEAELISNLKTKYPYILFERYTIDPLDRGQYKPFDPQIEHYSPGSKVQYNGQLYYARNGVSGVNAPGTHDAWDSVAVSTFPEYTSEHQNYVKGRIVTANGQLYLATQYTKKDPTKTPSWAKWGGWPWMPLGENSCN